jgi:hypothetical protein
MPPEAFITPNVGSAAALGTTESHTAMAEPIVARMTVQRLDVTKPPMCLASGGITRAPPRRTIEQPRDTFNNP